MSATLTPGQRDALAQLMSSRFCAKKMLQTKRLIQVSIELSERIIHNAIRFGDRKAEAIARIDLEATRENLIENKFKVIEFGRWFSTVCAVCEAQQLPREVWLRALSVNESEWGSDDMRQYGQSIMNVVTVLDLENSATKDDSIEYKPLKWCTTMAMMNATKTNPKLGEFMHDSLNEAFDGVFGEYKEPTILQRLGVAG
jgi:xanthine dehydrogenase molybdopterin-binding subunit B